MTGKRQSERPAKSFEFKRTQKMIYAEPSGALEFRCKSITVVRYERIHLEFRQLSVGVHPMARSSLIRRVLGRRDAHVVIVDRILDCIEVGIYWVGVAGRPIHETVGQ